MYNQKVTFLITLLMVTIVPYGVQTTTVHAEAARPVAIAARVSDPLAEKQKYLQQIHVNEAWNTATGSGSIVIAMVDTGVDLDHPDLKANLIDGVNLIYPDESPRDDNGHGTNVAGIIGAVPNNDRGISGIIWNTRMMPIKALESDGTGGEAKLGEGIKYAVDHGAKIVVLSLGLNKYSDYMSGIAQYAEDHNVLLVAAAGNEGNRIKFPAAYPTVLAVGGVAVDKSVHNNSNTGPELDVVAPWDVFTTAMGGGYEYKDGTSMAAPQVAAAAALVWAKNPWMKPYEVRNLIRQTAEDIGDAGWDSASGYGMLRVDRLLAETYKPDMYEPNNSPEQAKAISSNKMISAVFSNGSDQDWYAIDAPYDGTVSLALQTDSGFPVQLTHIEADGTYRAYSAADGQTVPVRVTKGLNRVRLQLADTSVRRSVAYRLTTSFQIYRDQFEDNDRQYQAFVLPTRSQTITGTFDHDSDQDWYMLPIEQTGILRIKCTVDTARIDPVLFIQKTGEKGMTIDRGGDGAPESMSMEVFPGNYYIRVSNIKEYASPITGEYTLTIEYEPKMVDPNEPNDRPYQATTVRLDAAYYGVVDRLDDADWYTFKVTADSLIEFQLTNVPEPVRMSMYVYDVGQKPLGSTYTPEGQSSTAFTLRLQAGTYYVKLSASKPFDYQMYKFQAVQHRLVGGFADIGGHWAANDLLYAINRGLVDGYEGYRFNPDQPITRAEAAAAIARAFRLTKQNDGGYTDLPASHWAYPYVMRAAQAGIVDGYPDFSFAPNKPVTRMEMTAMMARAMKLTGKRRGAAPFADVDEDYWGTGILKQMKAEGWASGFEDGTFRPEQPATRAEFVTMLVGILN